MWCVHRSHTHKRKKKKKKRDMQVFSTFGRCWEEGLGREGGMGWWQWQHYLTPHPAKEGATPDTEALLWTPIFNKHPEPVCLPHQFALASYCRLLSHSLFLPPHNPPQLPLFTLSDFSTIQLPCHFFERQKVSPEIQDLPSGSETAVTQACSNSSKMEGEILGLHWAAISYLR